MSSPVGSIQFFKNELKIGMSKTYRDVHRLLHFNVNFGDTKALHQTARKVLQLLEIRSWDNNGDTKINDQTLAKLVGVSVRTIQRATRLLEVEGYIIKTYRRLFDETRGASHRNGFYTDRAIRCLRIFLTHRCQAKPTKSIGWRTDPRPQLDRELYKIHKSWITDVDYEYGYYPDGIMPAFSDLFDAMRKGILDPEVYSKHREYSEAREMGEQKAISILGKLRYQGAV